MSASLQIRSSENTDLANYRQLVNDDAKQSMLVRLIITSDGSNAHAIYGILDNLHRFQNLRELIVSGPLGGNTLPRLPESLRVLSLKSVSDLKNIVNLPASLQRIVIEDTQNLVSLCDEFPKHFDHLTELVLSGCKSLPETQLLKILKDSQSPCLRDVDLSDCQLLTRLPDPFSRSVERLIVSRCTRLVNFPNKISDSLYRLDADGCTSLESLAEDWDPRIRYVNLSGCRRLTDITSLRERICDKEFQTLFLHGSGVRVPPAWEHGRDSQTNVAVDTRDYFDDKNKSGAAQILRCKVLLLGNGGAGKTELSYRIRGEKRPNSDYTYTRVSTHGIQLHNLTDFAPRSGDRYNLHIWDFGGQDIYHNTHRVFATTGSVFLIVWDPTQDDQRTSKAYGDDAESVNYPIRYWLDYVFNLYPGFCPEIAIVCNDRENHYPASEDPSKSPTRKALMERLLLQVGPDYMNRIESVTDTKISFFVSNLACDGIQLSGDDQDRCKGAVQGQWREIDRWVKDAVIRIKETQGSMVPSYQERAYRMITDPNAKNNQDQKGSQSKSVERFGEDLTRYIQSGMHDCNPELKRNWNQGAFLTDQRVRRSLRSLTNIGCLYWDPKHTGDTAILDQRWAFKQVYRLLERESTSSIRQALLSRKGRFDEQFLQKHFWGATDIKDPAQQQLILSFMISIGVCLPLKKRWQYTIGQGQEYLSPEHLPEDNEEVSRLVQEHFEAMRVKPEVFVEQETLHDGHWNAIMRAIAEAYGTDASFYRNAILVQGTYDRHRRMQQADLPEEDREDVPWKILLTYTPVEYSQEASNGITPGKIDYMHSPSMTKEHLEEFEKLVKSLCPGGSGSYTEALEKIQKEFTPVGREPSIFLSYGWDPDERQTFYTAGVNYVEGRLLKCLPRDKVKRDKYSRKGEQNIADFMKEAINSDVAIVFLSDKYLKSWYCMWELCTLYDRINKLDQSVWKRIICVFHPTGQLENLEEIEFPKQIWGRRNYTLDAVNSINDRMLETSEPEKLRRLVDDLREAKNNLSTLKKEIRPTMLELEKWEFIPIRSQNVILRLVADYKTVPDMTFDLKLLGETEPFEVDPECKDSVFNWIVEKIRSAGYSLNE